MKKSIFIAISSIFMIFSCGNGNADNVSGDSGGKEMTNSGTSGKAEPCQVKFSVRNLSGGAKAKVIHTIGSTNILMDSLKADAAGTMQLQADTALPGGLYFLLFTDDTFIQFILDQDQQFEMTLDKNDPITTMEVTNSLDNQLLYENLKWENNFQVEFGSVNAQLGAATPGTEDHKRLDEQKEALIAKRRAHVESFRERHPNSFFTIYKLAGQNPVLQEPLKANGSVDTVKQLAIYKSEYWNDVDFGDLRLLHTPVLFNKLKTYIKDLTPQVIDSIIKYADKVVTKAKANKEVFKFVVNYIAIEYRKSTIMGGEAIFVHMIDNYFTDEQAWWSNPKELSGIRREANEMRPSLIGNIGQDLNCKNPNGQYESLYDLGDKYKVLYMWSYTCEHCQERTPVLAEVSKKYKSRGLEVYALCIDNEEAKWKSFIQKYGIAAVHNVWDPQYESDYYKKYHVDITPELYLLDKNNKIIAKDLHPNQLPEILDREL